MHRLFLMLTVLKKRKIIGSDYQVRIKQCCKRLMENEKNVQKENM